MKISTVIKTVLLGWIYGVNLLLALALWLCGSSGNILLGIVLIVLYRLSLWISPIAGTVICWLPLTPKVLASKKLLLNLIHLLICGGLFLICYLLFGNWY